MSGRLINIVVVLGTRPEAIKLGPLVQALRARPEQFAVTVVTTSQHRDLVAPVLAFFGIIPEYDLDIMQHAQSLHNITAKTLHGMAGVIERLQPDMIVVQGDTTTATAAALAGFYAQLPVVHVEAGLRTGNRYDPFPEETNRRLITTLATLHCAATEANRQNLLREGIDPAAIAVTGNTVIDALQQITSRHSALPIQSDILANVASEQKVILLTTHRRENFGEPQRNIFRAVNRILDAHADVEVVMPVHPNPNIQEALQGTLRPNPRLHLVEPLDYISFVGLMNAAYLIMTDSGGIQEEAPALGKPVVVLRRTTERNELVECGNGVLAGVEEEDIVGHVENLLADAELYRAMSSKAFPFGEGGAAERIADAIQGI